jgi:hypothetical protein
MSHSIEPNSNNVELQRLVYKIQTKLGIHPKWENNLINTDAKLKVYKELKDKGICSRLYYLRINYLKGWITKL